MIVNQSQFYLFGFGVPPLNILPSVSADSRSLAWRKGEALDFLALLNEKANIPLKHHIT
jgi:hypothetical protein